MKLNKIIQCLEKWAPPIYQESYDNSGLMVGDYESEISGCLISLDCTEKVVDEAISKNCNLIVSHHPIIFGGISSINSIRGDLPEPPIIKLPTEITFVLYFFDLKIL